MSRFDIRLWAVIYVSLGAGSVLAWSELKLDSAKVGQKIFSMTMEDSIRTPDFSKIQLDGYQIENAVFIEENDASLPLLTSPALVDITARSDIRIVQYSPGRGMDPGALFLEGEPTFRPQPGMIFSDTSHGGVLVRVIQVDAQESNSGGRARWMVGTVPSSLTDAVLGCDLSFVSKIDMNLILQDASGEKNLSGRLADNLSAKVEYGLKDAGFLFQPLISGRLRIANGKVEIFQVQLNGNCEVFGDLSGRLQGIGAFSGNIDLPQSISAYIPLGQALFIKVRSDASLGFDFQSRSRIFSGKIRLRIQNDLKAGLNLSSNGWKPTSEQKLKYLAKPVKESSGEGEMKISLQPRIQIMLAGAHQSTFHLNNFARLSSIGSEYYGSWGIKDSVIFNLGSRELFLGSGLFIHSQGNFHGSEELKTFNLYNREQSTRFPPHEGFFSVKPSDSGKVILRVYTDPRADYYLVQKKSPEGTWETVIERAKGTRFKIGGLKPNTQYRFRLLGVNEMGVGAPIPLEGIAYTTPAINLPPLTPFLPQPSVNAIMGNGSFSINWRGGDPDSGQITLYRILLDTLHPPRNLIADEYRDTIFKLAGLKHGYTYYWKIIASDGTERTEGPVWSFSLKEKEKIPPSNDGPQPKNQNLVRIPGGSFLRNDGKRIEIDPFRLQKFEVMQADYLRIMGKNPSFRWGDSLPVEKVTWDEAVSYCSEIGGRLPTEAEWEYAARAGGKEEKPWRLGDAGDYAWYYSNSENRTQRVGVKKSNAWGLYDMIGNVFEWVQDWYGEYSVQDAVNPRGPSSGTAKVIRGASWYSEIGNLDASSRFNNRPGIRNFKVGFRCAMEADSISAATGIEMEIEKNSFIEIEDKGIPLANHK